jgi:hypothetical protein
MSFRAESPRAAHICAHPTTAFATAGRALGRGGRHDDKRHWLPVDREPVAADHLPEAETTVAAGCATGFAAGAVARATTGAPARLPSSSVTTRTTTIVTMAPSRM